MKPVRRLARVTEYKKRRVRLNPVHSLEHSVGHHHPTKMTYTLVLCLIAALAVGQSQGRAVDKIDAIVSIKYNRIFHTCIIIYTILCTTIIINIHDIEEYRRPWLYTTNSQIELHIYCWTLMIMIIIEPFILYQTKTQKSTKCYNYINNVITL